MIVKYFTIYWKNTFIIIPHRLWKYYYALIFISLQYINDALDTLDTDLPNFLLHEIK